MKLRDLCSPADRQGSADAAMPPMSPPSFLNSTLSIPAGTLNSIQNGQTVGALSDFAADLPAPERVPPDLVTPASSAGLADPTVPETASETPVAQQSELASSSSTEIPFDQRFSPLKKRIIVILVSFAALMGPLGTHFYNAGLESIAEDLNTSETLVNATVTVYSLVLAVAPLIWGPLSDRIGRRLVYLCSASVFVVGCLGCFFAVNIGMLIAFRFVQGSGASAVMSVGAGTIADIYRKEERGRAYGTYWVLPLISPVISAPLGGLICQYLGWRYVFAISLGMGGTIFIAILTFLPETLPASKRKAKKRPSMLAGIYALRYPFVALVTLDASCLFAALWSLNSMLPHIYSAAYGFQAAILGATMAATAAGNLTGSVLGGVYADMMVISWKRRRRGILIAEDRLKTTWMAGIAVPVGLLLFGWAPDKGISVAVAIIGQILIGYGTLSATSSENTYLIDCFSESPASIVSANNCIRYLAAAIMPVVSPTGVASIGSGWFYTIIAVVKTVGTLSVTWVSAKGSSYRLKREPWASQKLVPVKGWLEEWKADVEKKKKRLDTWVAPMWSCFSNKPMPWRQEGWGGIPPELLTEGSEASETTSVDDGTKTSDETVKIEVDNPGGEGDRQEADCVGPQVEAKMNVESDPSEKRE